MIVEVQEVQTLHGNIKALCILIVQLPITRGYSYRPQTDCSSGPGRPRYRISLEQLSCLRSEFNSWTQIASDLGVSRQTIYNRRRELGFSINFEGYTNISNHNLDTAVLEELRAFTRTGETNV